MWGGWWRLQGGGGRSGMKRFERVHSMEIETNNDVDVVVGHLKPSNLTLSH